MLPLCIAALLAAAPEEVERCKQALAKVTSHEAPERIDAFQACGPLLGDTRIRTAWFDAVHTSPFDAASTLALAANEPVPGAAAQKNACARTRSTLSICNGSRAEVSQLRPSERAAQWKPLFMRLLAADLPPAQAEVLQDAFALKWPLLFPDAPPPGVVNTSTLKVSGNIDRVELLRALGKVRPALDRCLPTPEAELGLNFTVDGKGKVQRFAVLMPADAKVAACLTQAFKAAVLPAPTDFGAAVVVWTPEPSGGN